jgi:hypothetical protein
VLFALVEIKFNVAPLISTFSMVTNDFDEPIEHSLSLTFTSEFQFLGHMSAILRVAQR